MRGRLVLAVLVPLSALAVFCAAEVPAAATHPAMRRANRKDLARLKRILESEELS